jgi:hypothetical protein
MVRMYVPAVVCRLVVTVSLEEAPPDVGVTGLELKVAAVSGGNPITETFTGES